jgi:hypothetical protein
MPTTGPPLRPSSWRDYTDYWLTLDQVKMLRARETDGWNPAMLFLEAQSMAQANLDDQSDQRTLSSKL